MTKYCYSSESIYLDTVSDQQHLFLNTWESVLLATKQCVDLTYIEHAKKWKELSVHSSNSQASTYQVSNAKHM